MSTPMAREIGGIGHHGASRWKHGDLQKKAARRLMGLPSSAASAAGRMIFESSGKRRVTGKDSREIAVMADGSLDGDGSSGQCVQMRDWLAPNGWETELRALMETWACWFNAGQWVMGVRMA